MTFKEKWQKFLEESKLTAEEKEKFKKKEEIVLEEIIEEDPQKLPEYKWYDPRKIRFGTCLIIGIISNVFFFLFIIIAMYYYELFQQFGETNLGLEITAWTCEALGFALMAFCIAGICFRVEGCNFTKKLIIIYLLVETMVMILDFNLLTVSWFNVFSTPLIICHAIFSAFVCYSYSAFDPFSKLYKFFVVLAALISLGGMLWLVFRFQIYLSVLTNCGAYLLLYIASSILHHLEIINVRCNGDPVKVIETKSIFFE
ncbi:MAG: hypothetical protein LBM93_08100 [Oscillospiraceae bacterium]|jgi:hypothetical protein|nr:hypothetical protein [Oscillospiraceae bacterium]